MKIWIGIFVALVVILVAFISEVNKKDGQGKDSDKWDELTVTLEVKEPATVKFNFTCEKSDVCSPKTGEYPAPKVDFPTELEINWGDGQTSATDSHDYQAAGTYVVKIRGKKIGTFDSESESNVDISDITVNNWPGLVYLNMCLPKIDFTQCPNLEYAYCSLNDPRPLDFSKCPKLIFLLIRGAMTGLNVTGCTELIVLDCSGCQLTGLDVSTCTKLNVLDCFKNQITQLSLNSALTTFQCSDNKLTNLDVSKSPELTVLFCDNNQLSHTALDNIYHDLPRTNKGRLAIEGNPGTGDTNLATQKGWKIITR